MLREIRALTELAEAEATIFLEDYDALRGAIRERTITAVIGAQMPMQHQRRSFRLTDGQAYCLDVEKRLDAIRLEIPAHAGALLHARLLEGRTWRAIADAVGTSEQRIKAAHRAAVLQFVFDMRYPENVVSPRRRWTYTVRCAREELGMACDDAIHYGSDDGDE